MGGIFAICFYGSYKRAETYLMNTMSSAISSIIGRSEDRLSRLIYKLPVEIAMQNRLIAYDKNFTENAIEQIREISEEEVRSIIGYWEK